MRAVDVVRAYDGVLEQQILGRGSCLACQDEELRTQVEELLMDSDPREVHRLGLDPLRVMEESLKAAAAYGRRGRPRRGLQGLAKAFEVLEQAALNLYLGPWREEYKVIKMYSGTFTHYITPVLSMPQTEKVFGLLGYHPGPSRPEQLCLQSARVSPASLEDLLRLSCAFFLARCECLLLLAALGKRGGDAQWELSVVRERQRGHRLQVAVDNAEKQLSIQMPAAGMELPDGEVDLYREEQVNGRQEDEDPPSSVSTAPPGGQRRRNGPTSVLEPDAAARSRRFGQMEVDKGRSEDLCKCLHSPLRLQHCLDCNVLHDITCVYLADCNAKHHHQVEPAGSSLETRQEMEEEPPRSRNLRENISEVLSVAAVSSSSARSESPGTQPISYHCETAKVDPQLLCHTCNTFHSSSCVEGRLCRSSHETKRLGSCSCGKFCSRKPLVLCHYCGNEFCRECWYKNPLACVCGHTFDLSTSV
ncbi:spermatogenesis associated 2-like isoform 1-T2 [Anableps anableps]